jgi:rubrerythrin
MNTFSRFFILMIFSVSLVQCNSSKPVKTIEDLKTAINSESTDSEKYAKFAQKAVEEGYDTIAKLFEATSVSEKIHASNHRKVLEKYKIKAQGVEIGSYEIKTTLQNLQAAIGGETYEMQTRYPVFIRNAENEKAAEAAKSYTWAWDGEKKHLIYFRRVESLIGKGNETGISFEWYVCPNCGNLYNPTDVKESCDFCLTKRADFIGYTEESAGEK